MSVISKPPREQVFQDDWGFAAAWTHYVVFDMVVGAWIARDSVRLGMLWLLRTVAYRDITAQQIERREFVRAGDTKHPGDHFPLILLGQEAGEERPAIQEIMLYFEFEKPLSCPFWKLTSSRRPEPTL